MVIITNWCNTYKPSTTRTVKGQFPADSLNYVIVFVNINTLFYWSLLIIHLHLKTFDRTTEAGFYSVQIYLQSI